MRTHLRTYALPLVVLVILATLTMIRLDRPLVRGDGVAYLAWLDTFVRDRDLDLANQHERFAPVNNYQITWDVDLERYVNIFPFGVAFLQAPFYVAGGALTSAGLADQNPDYFLQMQGVNQGYSLMLMLGANLMALGAMLAAWLVALRFTDRWTATALAFAFFLGTPLVYYSTISPLNSHNPGAFLVAVLVAIMLYYDPRLGIDRTERESPPLWAWITIGIVAGLMVVVRWQLAAVAAFAWIFLAWQYRDWRRLALATGLAVIMMLPIPLVWNEMFGKPFVVPYDESTNESFLHLPRNAHRVFFRMVRYSPMLALSLLGLPFLWHIDRRWTIFSAAAIGAQLLINGSTKDWYAGDSFGARRMSELYIFYVLLAAALLGQLAREMVRTRRAIRPVGGRVLLVALTVYAVFFLAVFMVYTWTNPDYLFIDTPQTMIDYYFDHPDPGYVIDKVFETHLGPPAWDRPGP